MTTNFATDTEFLFIYFCLSSFSSFWLVRRPIFFSLSYFSTVRVYHVASESIRIRTNKAYLNENVSQSQQIKNNSQKQKKMYPPQERDAKKIYSNSSVVHTKK